MPASLNTNYRKTNIVDFKINDKIIIKNENRKKFDPLYRGPYIIKEIEKENLTIFEIKTGKTSKIHKNNAIKYIS